MAQNLSKRPRGLKLWTVLMRLGHYAGCHQIYERSFTFRGYQFPVCARCTGIFLGQIVAVVFFLAGYTCSVWLGLLLVGAMALDGTVQLLTKYQSNNIRRLITGLLAGFGFVSLCLRLLVFLINRF